jgi:anaerobic glycerol-3-phosphate dehydrogenase
LGRSWIQLLGLHSEVMFDNHLVDEALYGAGCEVVDTVVDIPSLMQFVDGRRGPPTREFKAMDVAEAFT